MKKTTPSFPFTAVSGQPAFKLALILAAINPSIGGVLVSGPRGLAKSTLARGLANILPTVHESSTLEEGQQSSTQLGQKSSSQEGQKPRPAFVTLPLGASEEMLVGTLNLQQVLDQKQLVFQAGLLSKADQGILYVDEVNLLPDNLVDLLLDVAASGVNVVERDGISQEHRAQFLLLGTMNPDEGELRPQLLDRFGLFVSLTNNLNVQDRIEIVKLREAFDRDPLAFNAQYSDKEHALRNQIAQARAALPHIVCGDDLRTRIAQRCHDANVDGLRADIVWYKAASAHCALEGRQVVTQQDIDAVEDLVLSHRRKPSQTPPSTPPASPYSRPAPRENQSEAQSSVGDWGKMEPVQQATCEQAELRLPPMTQADHPNQSLRVISQSFMSRLKGSGSKGSKASAIESQKVDWFGTFVRHAGQWPVKHFKYKKARSGQIVLNLVLLDTSASVLRNQLFGKAKAVVLGIAEQAYVHRERLTVLGFGNQSVNTLLPQRRAPKELKSLLDAIPASGGTPMREMLRHALDYQKQQLRRMPELKLRTFLISDGRSSQSFQDLTLMGEVTVIDMEDAIVKRGKAKALAQTLRANYFAFPQLASVHGYT